MATTDTGVQLDSDIADFIAGVTSISIAARNAQLLPSAGKAVGCQVSADRRRLTVFIEGEKSPQLVADIAAGSPVAVVFSKPATHRTVQIKGDSASIAVASTAQRVSVGLQVDAIVEHLAALGYAEPVLRAVFGAASPTLLAVQFAPVAVFAQTPGPRAGEKIAG